MYKISDFALKAHISKDTLRYYDKIDFFKPSYIDYFSGYRYYVEDQVAEIEKINNLKEIGFSLKEIQDFLLTNDKNILLKKRNEMRDKMEKIEKILNNNQKDVYTIKEGDYKKYIEINGTKSATCPQALEVRDHNAFYFVVSKNDTFLCDFCIYKKENWITLDTKYLANEDIMEKIGIEISNVVSFVTFFIPSEEEKLLSKFTSLYKDLKVTEVKQGPFLYKKVYLSFTSINR